MFHSSFMFFRFFCTTITTLPNFCNKSSTPLLQTLPFHSSHIEPFESLPDPCRGPAPVGYPRSGTWHWKVKGTGHFLESYLLLFTLIFFFSCFVFCYVGQLTMVKSRSLFLSRTWMARGHLPRMGKTKSNKNKKIKKKEGKEKLYSTCFLFAPVYGISWIHGTFREILSNNIL